MVQRHKETERQAEYNQHVQTGASPSVAKQKQNIQSGQESARQNTLQEINETVT